MTAKAPRRTCSKPGCGRLCTGYHKICEHCRPPKPVHVRNQERHLLVIAFALGLIKQWPLYRIYDMRLPSERRSRNAAFNSRWAWKARTLRKLREEGIV